MKRLLYTILFVTACCTANAQAGADSLVFERIATYARVHNLQHVCNPGERVRVLAEFFLGTPYVGGTLEAAGAEQLRINLREMDCTTLVENVLALSRTVVAPKPSFDTFKNNLMQIRYRSGKLTDYTSRLHYSTDWIADNISKKNIRFVEMGAQVVDFIPAVGFMSSHPAAYPALKADSSFVPVMASHEKRINQIRMKYLPKAAVTPDASFIQDGDVILITTSTTGLDFSHMGFAFRKQNRVYLLHASSSAKKVVVSDLPLSDYLAGIKKHTGIVVLRPSL